MQVLALLLRTHDPIPVLPLMNQAFLWAILALAALDATLLVFLLVRSPKAWDDASKVVRDELRLGREESQKSSRELRDELAATARVANDALNAALGNLATLQRDQLEGLTRQLRELTASNQASLDRIRLEVESRVKELQQSNESKLEEMRRTVDEKLHEALEKRLGESFKLVSERLEAVQKGLGEMQSLASGVGDLRKVLTNVKTRGTWGEVQLGAILDQILAPGQFERNVRTKAGSGEVVEFAIRLPGRRDDPSDCVWLPIDSKFPQEDYLRLQEAADNVDPEGVARATAALARAVRLSAQDICDKYINPPQTTDFALLFLPTEGLYAEVLRQPALAEELQFGMRVVVAGPTTLAAIVSSLRMGFQTLAIEQRASEVWNVLRAVKTEFGKFGETLDRVKRQLNTATRTLEQTGVRTRAMEKQLRAAEALPIAEAEAVLGLGAGISSDEGDSTDGAVDELDDDAGG
jgi:DNA recombination protein RmuC